MCYDMFLKRAREDRHEIPLPFLLLKKKCISHNKILKCVSGTYRQGGCTIKFYICFFFVFFDNSGHVLKNSSMILNSGDFIYCFILHRDLWVRYAPIVVCFFPQRGQPSCSQSSGIV